MAQMSDFVEVILSNKGGDKVCIDGFLFRKEKSLISKNQVIKLTFH